MILLVCLSVLIKFGPNMSLYVQSFRIHNGLLLTMLNYLVFPLSSFYVCFKLTNFRVYYFQTNPHARNMCCKSWPYYKDWVNIFGKDRATGESGVQHNNLGTKPSLNKGKAPGTYLGWLFVFNYVW